jgi:uncharacterized membrane protein
MMKRRLLMLAVVFAVAAAAHIGTVLAVPRLVMHIVTGRMAALAGVNTPLHMKPVSAVERAVPLPSPDLLYSSCVLDASRGPVAVSVTPGNAYLSLAVFDMRSDNIFVSNDQAAAGQPIRLLVAAPGQAANAPPGVRVVRLGSSKGLLLLRGLAATPELARISDQARHTLSCHAA